MSFDPSPSSPHLWPQQTVSRPASRTGRADEALLRGAIGAKKLLSSWSRSRAATPEPLAPLCTLTRSQSQLQRSSPFLDATMAQADEMMAARTTSRVSRYPTAPSTERQPTLARSLMNKSSRLLQKRKSTPKLRTVASANVSAFSGWDDDDDSVMMPALHSPSLLQKSPPQPAQPCIRKDSISIPYNFQHLTHTNQKHALTLQGTRRENLVTEFCAFRAAQKPQKELKGIKADDLPSPLNSEATSLASPRATSPRQSPTASRAVTPRNGRGLKTSKSVDNLRPVAHRSFSAPLTCVNPPPRKSSRKPTNLAHVMVDMEPVPRPLDSPTLPTPGTAVLTQSPASYGFPSTVSTPATEISYQDSAAEIAQAVTTPDDSACEMAPRTKKASVTTLADPTETDESGTKTSERASQQSLRHIKSMPSVKHFSRSFNAIQWGSQTSLNSTDPTLPSPGHAQEDVPAGPTRRLSSQPKAMHESWEDSVDYCYDYAMDEDDLDALVMGASHDTPTGAATPAMTGSANSSAVSFQETNVSLVPTPSLPYALSPSLLAPKEYASRMTHEEQYAHRLSEDELEDFKSLYNYSFYFHSGLDGDALPPPASSPRSSGSGGSRRAPLSKSSSQDSFASRYSASEHASKPTTTTATPGPAPRLLRAKASREQLGLLSEGGASNLPHAIDTMRQDLLRAVEAMPDAAFDDALARTMSPTPPSKPPSRLGRRTPSHDEDLRVLDIPEEGPAASYARPAPTPRYTGLTSASISPHHPQSRSRAASAASAKPAPRMPAHRTSYSLFPQMQVGRA